MDMRSKPKQRLSTSIRMTVLAVVAICIVLLMNQRSDAHERALRVAANEDQLTKSSVSANGNTCLDTLLRAVFGLGASVTTATLYSDGFPLSKEAKIGISGSSRVILARDFHGSVDMQFFEQQHKAVETKTKSMALLYPDNTVVTVDVTSCLITGIYFSDKQTGAMHVAVQKELSATTTRTLQRAARKCTKTRFFRCRRSGATCRVSGGCHKDQCSARCPDGWTPRNQFCTKPNSNCPRLCGCDSTPCILDCKERGKFGNCPLSQNACQRGNLAQHLEPTLLGMDIVQKALQVGSILTGVLPPPLGVGVNLVISLFGLGGGSDFDAYIQVLDSALAQLETCIDQKFALFNKAEILTKIQVIENNLSPSLLRGFDDGSDEVANAEARETHVWEKNEVECNRIAASFQVRANDQFIELTLPLAVKAMDLCMITYVGHVADRQRQNKNIKFTYRAYRDDIRNTLAAVQAAIQTVQTRLSTRETCHFFNYDKTKLADKLRFLRDEVETPLKELKSKMEIADSTLGLTTLVFREDGVTHVWESAGKSPCGNIPGVYVVVGSLFSKKRCEKVTGKEVLLTRRPDVVVLPFEKDVRHSVVETATDKFSNQIGVDVDHWGSCVGMCLMDEKCEIAQVRMRADGYGGNCVMMGASKEHQHDESLPHTKEIGAAPVGAVQVFDLRALV